MILRILVLALVVELVCGESVATSITRDLNAPAVCSNTRGGRWYITDDQGIVCSRDQFDYSTGCCPASAPKHSCDTCDDIDGCCVSYEHCVSCCMSPENKPEDGLKSAFRGFGKPETGHWATVFEYCQNECMTTARSTQHENAFIMDRRFCFSELGRPLEKLDKEPPPLADGVMVVLSAPGSSCDEACFSQQKSCVVDQFEALNNCNILRTHFMCEAGCGPASGIDIQFPGYITGKAPKQNWPAYCAWLPPLENADIPSFNCSTTGHHIQRLCACTETTAEIVPLEGTAAAAVVETSDQVVDEGGNPQEQQATEQVASEAFLETRKDSNAEQQRR